MKKAKKKRSELTQLASPASTGGLGLHFEENVQASYVCLMLTNGFAPGLTTHWPIEKIKLQGKHAGYQTDDLILFTKEPETGRTRKLLGQAKHKITFTKGDTEFAKTIASAWDDFNNSSLFKRGSYGDAIALITGPLSGVDTDSVRPMLERARAVEDASEFFQDMQLGKFTSDDSRERLEAFKFHLKNANNGVEPAKEEIYEFLKSFHLLIYDLDIKYGANAALIKTLLANATSCDPADVWGRIVLEVRPSNHTAGTITRDSLPEEILEKFAKKETAQIPEELLIPREVVAPVEPPRIWATDSRVSSLVTAWLLGSWNDNKVGDREVAGQLTTKSYDEWTDELRRILHEQDSPISLRNGIWKVSDKKALLQQIGGNISDGLLDTLRQNCIAVLSEIDPKYELEPEKWLYAVDDVYQRRFSKQLREGIAESVTALANNQELLKHCSQDRAREAAILSVRELLKQGEAKHWASLNDQLPRLAQAAPQEFLHQVEAALQQTPCPFAQLFSREGEGEGMFGANYMTGILWALEALAWDPKLLGKTALALAALAKIDVGGQSMNRPKSSLREIFLPWKPHTHASAEKQQVAVKAILAQYPSVGWKLLLGLLPQSRGVSFGTYEPQWLTLETQDFDLKPTPGQYRGSVTAYSEFALSEANHSPSKLRDLIHFIDQISQKFFDTLIKQLTDKEVVEAGESERKILWETLVSQISRHRRFPKSDWSMAKTALQKLDEVVEKLTPEKPQEKFRRLFGSDEFSLYDGEGEWAEQEKRLSQKRDKAVRGILKSAGVEGVKKFAGEIEMPVHVGSALGRIADSEIEQQLLPQELTTTDQSLDSFMRGFVCARIDTQGSKWIDELKREQWSFDDNLRFLMHLRFTEQTWAKVTEWLGEKEREYWQKVQVNPVQVESELTTAAQRLLDVQRPLAAVDCLYWLLHRKEPVDEGLTIQALSAAVHSTEAQVRMDQHHVIELVTMLQESPSTDQQGLLQIEMIYLPMLDRFSTGRPVTLEKALATNPQLFCEIIQNVYRSENKLEERELTQEEKSKAEAGWRLLEEWRLPPGMAAPDAKFSAEAFQQWMEEVKRLSEDSGHTSSAYFNIGEVLFYLVGDSEEGVWLPNVVAQALNAQDAERMRNGFTQEVYNRQNGGFVDPKATPELERAAMWEKRANAMDDQGLYQFAAALRELEQSYRRDAQRILNNPRRED